MTLNFFYKKLRFVYAIFRKEMWVQSRFRLALLNHLLVGPLVGAIPVAFLYTGIFRFNGNLNLGELNQHNYSPFLVFGFLIHTCLNSGYYCLSSRILNEWWYRTLPIHFLSSCDLFTLIVGWTSLDFLRCTVLSTLLLFILSLSHPLSGTFLLWSAVTLMTIYLFGVLIGLLRSFFLMTNEGNAELLNHFYMAFLFLSFLYLPPALVPPFLRSISQFSPAYHASQLLLEIWSANPLTYSHPIGLFAITIFGFIFISLLAWKYSTKLVEICFR